MKDAVRKDTVGLLNQRNLVDNDSKGSPTDGQKGENP